MHLMQNVGLSDGPSFTVARISISSFLNKSDCYQLDSALPSMVLTVVAILTHSLLQYYCMVPDHRGNHTRIILGNFGQPTVARPTLAHPLYADHDDDCCCSYF
jgi:hypothetical protein